MQHSFNIEENQGDWLCGLCGRGVVIMRAVQSCKSTWCDFNGLNLVSKAHQVNLRRELKYPWKHNNKVPGVFLSRLSSAVSHYRKHFLLGLLQRVDMKTRNDMSSHGINVDSLHSLETLYGYKKHWCKFYSLLTLAFTKLESFFKILLFNLMVQFSLSDLLCYNIECAPLSSFIVGQRGSLSNRTAEPDSLQHRHHYYWEWNLYIEHQDVHSLGLPICETGCC